MTEQKRLYTALVRDAQTKDMLVFAVRAADPADVRSQITDFYKEQGWGVPGHIQVVAFRVGMVKPVLVGHAYWEYEKLQEQISELCAKLMEAADGMEINEGDVAGRDALYAYLATFEAGKKLIDAKYS